MWARVRGYELSPSPHSRPYQSVPTPPPMSTTISSTSSAAPPPSPTPRSPTDNIEHNCGTSSQTDSEQKEDDNGSVNSTSELYEVD